MNKRQKIVQERFIGHEEAVIKRLKQVYNQALKDIEGKSKALQDAINQLDALAKLPVDEAEKEQLLSMKQSKIYQKQYQDALKKQIGSILDNMQVEEFKTVSDYLQKCYEDGFIGTMYDLQGQGIPLCMPLDQEAIVRAVQTDSKISNGLYSRLGEDVSKLKRKITAQVSRGISTGLSFQEVARNLAAVTAIGYNNAVRIARTEGHRIQVQSTMDACYKAKEKGADVVKQWDATLDRRTRPSHGKVDGEIRELDEPFSNGLMFPGDPDGGAAEVVNCRCALLQRAKWALDEEELEELKERAEYFGLDKTDSFDDFKKKYLKAAEQIEEADNSFASVLSRVELSPHSREYKTFEEYWAARKAFSGKETEYLEDVFVGKFELQSDWGADDGKRKIAQIENTLAELQKKWPMNPSKDLEHGIKFRRINVCDYDNAWLYLPDGKGDRRLTSDAIGQVFENDDVVTIAFGRDWMYQTMEEALKERAKTIVSGEVLSSVNAGSPQTVAIHEWGHLMSNHITNAFIYDDETAQEYWQWYKSLSKDEIRAGLSEYATTNRAEFEAECFAELQMPNPRPLALKFAEFLNKCIEKGY